MKTGLRSSAGLFLLKIANVGLTFGATVLLTRWLGAEGYGSYSVVLAVIMLLNVPVAQGIGNLLVRQAARGLAQEAWADLKGLLIRGHQAGVLAAILAGILMAGAFALVPGRAEFLTPVIIALGAGIVLADGLSGLRAATIRGLGQPFLGQLPDQFLKPLGFALAVLVAQFVVPDGGTAAWALGAFAVGSLLGFAVGWVILLWKAPDGLKRAEPEYHDRAWGPAALAFAGTAGLLIVNGYTDLFILTAFTDLASVGAYRVAYQIATLVSLFYTSINLVVAPRFAYHKTRGEASEMSAVASSAARAAFLAAVPILIGAVVAGEWVLAEVFGEEFRPAYVPMVILMVGQVFNSGIGFVASLLTMTGWERRVMRWAGVGVAVNAVLSLALAPLLGPTGAAIASAAGSVSWNLGLWFSVVRIHGFDPSALGLPVERWHLFSQDKD